MFILALVLSPADPPWTMRTKHSPHLLVVLLVTVAGLGASWRTLIKQEGDVLPLETYDAAASSRAAERATSLTSEGGPALHVASSLRQAHNKSFLVLEQLGYGPRHRWIVKPDYGDHEAVHEIVACAIARLLGFDLCRTSAYGITIPVADGPEYNWNQSVRSDILRECTQKSDVHCREGGVYVGAALVYLPTIKEADSELGRRLLNNTSAFQRFVKNAAQLLLMDIVFQIDNRFRNCFFLADTLQLTSLDSGDWLALSYRHGDTIMR